MPVVVAVLAMRYEVLDRLWTPAKVDKGNFSTGHGLLVCSALIETKANR